MSDDRRKRYNYISASGTNTVKSAPGTLWQVVVGTPVASSTITIYDNTAGSGTVLALITNTTDVKPYRLEIEARFETGLTVVTSGNDKVTLVYS